MRKGLPKAEKEAVFDYCVNSIFYNLIDQGFAVLLSDNSLFFLPYDPSLDDEVFGDYVANHGPCVLCIHFSHSPEETCQQSLISYSDAPGVIRKLLHLTADAEVDIAYSPATGEGIKPFEVVLDDLRRQPDSGRGAKFGKKVNVAAIEHLLGGRRPKVLSDACKLSPGTAKRIFKLGRCRQSEDGSARDGNTIEALVEGLAKLSGLPPDEVRSRITS